MNKEPEIKELVKPIKGKVFRNIWFVSVVGFIVSIISLLFGVLNDSDSLLNMSTLMTILFVGVGGVSFFIWLLISANKLFKIMLLALPFVVILFFAIQLFVVQWAIVEGLSMEPSYKNGDRYIVNVIAFKVGSPERKDVVKYIFNDQARMGRIIGLPKETISIKKGEVSINNNALDEQYSDWKNWKEDEAQEYKLNDDEYLILFDNRNGLAWTVRKNMILGKFIYKI